MKFYYHKDICMVIYLMYTRSIYENKIPAFTNTRNLNNLTRSSLI